MLMLGFDLKKCNAVFRVVSIACRLVLSFEDMSDDEYIARPAAGSLTMAGPRESVASHMVH